MFREGWDHVQVQYEEAKDGYVVHSVDVETVEPLDYPKRLTLFPNGIIHDMREDSILLHRRDGTVVLLKDELLRTIFLIVHDHAFALKPITVDELTRLVESWDKELDEDLAGEITLRLLTVLDALNLLNYVMFEEQKEKRVEDSEP